MALVIVLVELMVLVNAGGVDDCGEIASEINGSGEYMLVKLLVLVNLLVEMMVLVKSLVELIVLVNICWLSWGK